MAELKRKVIKKNKNKITDMEDVMRRAGHEGLPIEERWVNCAEDDGGCREEVAAAATKIGSKRPYHENDNDLKSSSPEHTELSKPQAAAATKMERFNLEPDSKASSLSKKEQDHQLESARAEMGEVKEENQRLKMYLDRIMKDYRTLQMQFYDVVRQEETKNSTDDTGVDDHHQGNEESELISLRLGRCSSEPKKDAKSKGKDQTEQVKEGLSLGLDCTSFHVSKSDTNETLPNPRASPMNSFEEQKEEAGETWPPSKILKTMRSGDHDEVVQQNPAKKARVSVRARCDTPTMNDGCQWRKYGQKIAKGNPCPRAYYRCTVAPSCPVRKQVQRCPEDMSILVTTYEGTHNHPLPISATAMASTTSAAASMLLSGPNPSSNSSTIAANLHGLNSYLSDNSKSKPLYLHNSSSLSSSSPYPTITLDLTSNPSSSSSSSHFNRYSSSYPPIRNFASTSSLNFGASNPSNAISWGNGFLSYGSTTSQSYNRNQFGKLNPSLSNSQQLELPADTIAAATKAITTDPSFQSALTAALNSILTTGNSTRGANLGALKWGDQFPVANSLTSASTAKGNPCATSYLKNTNSTNSQPGSLMFVPPSLPFSAAPRSASASPADNKDHTS